MTTPVEWISTNPGPKLARRPMMQLQNTALALLNTIASGLKRCRVDHCISRYRIIAAVPSVSIVLRTARWPWLW